MEINKYEFKKAMVVHNYSVAKVIESMEISRSMYFSVMAGKRRPGYKFISGLKKAFPDNEVNKILVNTP